MAHGASCRAGPSLAEHSIVYTSSIHMPGIIYAIIAAMMPAVTGTVPGPGGNLQLCSKYYYSVSVMHDQAS